MVVRPLHKALFYALLLPGLMISVARGEHPDSTRTFQAVTAESFLVGELGGLVIADGKALIVRFVSPPANRKAPYKEVDLREGDVVLMVNGKRVKSVNELKAAYGVIAVGAEVKVGLERGKEMIIVAFPKADPKDLPQMKLMVQRGPGDGTELFPAVGVSMAQKGKRVVVQEVLPIETSAVRTLDVKAGDVILSLNGWAVTSLKAYTEKFDAIPVGAPVEWKTERDGRQLTISFARPKPMGQVIIRKTPQ
jgi:S1-C subfamily serine protease